MKYPVLFLSLLAVIFAGSAVADEKLKFEVGDELPDYLGKDPEGHKINLTDLRGRVVVISFWASWCAPCRKELPVLDALQRQAGDERLKVIAVNSREDRKIFRRLVKGMGEAVLTFTHDKRGSIGSDFGVSGIPHLFIVNPEGRLAYQAVGYGEESLGKMLHEVNVLLFGENYKQAAGQ